jgi:hypothetical protein
LTLVAVTVLSAFLVRIAARDTGPVDAILTLVAIATVSAGPRIGRIATVLAAVLDAALALLTLAIIPTRAPLATAATREATTLATGEPFCARIVFTAGVTHPVGQATVEAADQPFITVIVDLAALRLRGAVALTPAFDTALPVVAILITTAAVAVPLALAQAAVTADQAFWTVCVTLTGRRTADVQDFIADQRRVTPVFAARPSLFRNAGALKAAPSVVAVAVPLTGVLIGVGNTALENRVADLVRLTILVATATARRRLGDTGTLNAAAVAPAIGVLATLGSPCITRLRTYVGALRTPVGSRASVVV